MIRLKMHLVPACFLLALSACSGTGSEYEPVVDGPRDEKYLADLAKCRALSKQSAYVGGKTQTDATIGAGLGGVVGAISDGWEGLLVGLGVGAALGGGASAYDNIEKREEIIGNCMTGRGHKVVG
jgi:hypothetical protein